MEHEDRGGRLYGRYDGATNGARFRWAGIGYLLQKMEGVKIEPLFGPPRAGDVRHSMADTTAATAELGHAPQFSIEEGLKRDALKNGAHCSVNRQVGGLPRMRSGQIVGKSRLYCTHHGNPS